MDFTWNEEQRAFREKLLAFLDKTLPDDWEEFSKHGPASPALTSAATFTSGAAVPLIAAALLPQGLVIVGVVLASLVLLGLLGAIGAKVGGAGLLRPTLRVLVWGAVAMAVTAGIGRLFGAVV